MVLYNETDQQKAAWLWELIDRGHIAKGVVDTRPIQDLQPADLARYTQVHLFAGIGVWSYALRLAGWPDDVPVWTGSCPCQPFSVSGKQKGKKDDRHLWPHMRRLIAGVAHGVTHGKGGPPPVVLGEQVSGAHGYAWFDDVAIDLEDEGYTPGVVDSPACGYGAPHVRNRLYWVGIHSQARLSAQQYEALQRAWGWVEGGATGESGGAPADGRGTASGCAVGGLGHVPNRTGIGSQPRPTVGPSPPQHGQQGAGPAMPNPTNGFWASADWLGCRDGKFRPVEPGAQPMVDGSAPSLGRSRNSGLPINSKETSEARVVRLRGYGDGIVAPQAVEWIRAVVGAVVEGIV